MDRAPRTALALLAVVAAAIACFRLPALVPAIQDDGFIYFRIAENAAHGRGPVFTPGERVDAATSPVWMWLLAGATRLGIPPATAALALGLAGFMGAVLVAGLWALELAKPRGAASIGFALAGALLLAVDERFLFYVGSGMETLLCAGVWLWATRALVRRWLQAEPERGAGWAALAALLVRPEYGLFIAAVAGVALARRSARPAAILRTLAPTLIGAVLYLAVHWAYFGDPLPNTYYAKRAADWTHTRIGLGYVASFVRAYPWTPLFFLALVPRQTRVPAIAVGAGFLLYTAHLASLGGDHLIFHRAFLHVLPLAAALAGATAALAWQQRRPLLTALTVVLTALALAHAAQPRVRPGAFEWVRFAARLGETLAHTYPPTTRLGLFAIGATGYTSKLPVVDALGIADPHVARCDLSKEHVCELDIGHERGDPEYVLQHADVVAFFAAYSPVPFESLDEIREGFYSQKKFVAAAREEVERGRFKLRNVQFAPGAYWAVLEKTK